MKIIKSLPACAPWVLFMALSGSVQADSWGDALNAVKKAATQPQQSTQPQINSAQVLQQGQQVVNTAQNLPSGSLTQLLMSQTGVNQTQALTGAGALFQMAKTRMQPNSFVQLEKSIPDMQGMLAAVPTTLSKQGSSSSLVGSLASLAGSSGGTLGNLATVATIFQQSGMSTSMIQKFIPVLLNYTQSSGGSALSGLLSTALTGL
jgi:hypothetical protein